LFPWAGLIPDVGESTGLAAAGEQSFDPRDPVGEGRPARLGVEAVRGDQHGDQGHELLPGEVPEVLPEVGARGGRKPGDRAPLLLPQVGRVQEERELEVLLDPAIQGEGVDRLLQLGEGAGREPLEAVDLRERLGDRGEPLAGGSQVDAGMAVEARVLDGQQDPPPLGRQVDGADAVAIAGERPCADARDTSDRPRGDDRKVDEGQRRDPPRGRRGRAAERGSCGSALAPSRPAPRVPADDPGQSRASRIQA
jgi:hypothetical protein